jgi:hypothetical protein
MRDDLLYFTAVLALGVAIWVWYRYGILFVQ